MKVATDVVSVMPLATCDSCDVIVVRRLLYAEIASMHVFKSTLEASTFVQLRDL